MGRMAPANITMTQDAALVAGMDEDEAAAWEAVRVAATACLGLTKREGTHPMAREELCHDFHHIQAWLMAQPTYRKLMAVEKVAIIQDES